MSSMLNSEVRDTIRKAVGYLAGVCDHASSRDDVGFSANTAPLGHELANLPLRYWDGATFTVAAHVAFHHRGQLVSSGVIDDVSLGELALAASQPKPDGAVRTSWIAIDPTGAGLVVSVAAPMRKLTKCLKLLPGSRQPAGRGRVWQVPPAECYALHPHLQSFDLEEGVRSIVERSLAAAPEAAVLAYNDRCVLTSGDRLSVVFPYDEAMLARIKAVPGRKWDGDTWTMPVHADSAALIGQLEKEGFAVTGAAQALCVQGRDRPAQKTGGKGMSAVEVRDGIRIAFPYEPAWIDAVKGLDAGSRRYDGKSKCWTIDPDAVGELVERLQACTVPPSESNLDSLRSLAPARPKL